MAIAEWDSQMYNSEDCAKNAIIHWVATMLATSKNYFQVITTMLTTGTDDLTLWLSPERQRVISTGG